MMRGDLTRFERRSGECGFSMVEVLVTLMVVSLALLGTAGLQAHSMRLNQGGQYRSLAVFLAADLAERMEANRAGALAGNYSLPVTTGVAFMVGTTTPSVGCVANACNPAALAEFDLSNWQSLAANVLPQSSWSVVQTTNGARNDFTITIGWVDRRSKTTNATTTTTRNGGTTADLISSVGSNSAGTGEKFFYTANRTLFN